MSISRIEPTRDENNVRLEVESNGHDDGAEGGQILGVTHWRVQTSAPTHVHIETHPVLNPTLSI
jgi:hypothetical protein